VTATLPSLTTANVSAARARAVRAEWLTSLKLGLCTVPDLINHACSPDGRPLLRIGLVRLLTEQDGWTRNGAVATINQALRLLGQPEMTSQQASKLHVQWLVDSRSGGRRVQALTDAMDPKMHQPWGGFPYASRPQGDDG